jgi:hypothetical protein
MRMRLVWRGAIAGFIAGIIGIPMTLVIAAENAFILYFLIFYILPFCVFFGMLLTFAMGEIQEEHGKINILIRMIVMGLVGVIASCIFAIVINGIYFSIIGTGILSGMLATASNHPSETA